MFALQTPPPPSALVSTHIPHFAFRISHFTFIIRASPFCPSLLHLSSIYPHTPVINPGDYRWGQFTHAYLVRWTDLHRLDGVNLPSPRPRLGGRAVSASGVSSASDRLCPHPERALSYSGLISFLLHRARSLGSMTSPPLPLSPLYIPISSFQLFRHSLRDPTTLHFQMMSICLN